MAVGFVIIKRGWRHGVQGEEWSNKYHLSGPDPANPTAWRALFDALVTAEKECYSSMTSVVRGYGYVSDADDATAAYSIDLTVSPNTPVPGVMAAAGGASMPSDAAVWVRWKLDRQNSNGKSIFLRKYFHDAYQVSGGTGAAVDAVLPAQKTALNSFASLLFTGAGIDGGRHIRDKGGGNVIAAGISNFITTRTLKRRGKRP